MRKLLPLLFVLSLSTFGFIFASLPLPCPGGAGGVCSYDPDDPLKCTCGCKQANARRAKAGLPPLMCKTALHLPKH